jgi:hypothetical protein
MAPVDTATGVNIGILVTTVLLFGLACFTVYITFFYLPKARSRTPGNGTPDTNGHPTVNGTPGAGQPHHGNGDPSW